MNAKGPFANIVLLHFENSSQLNNVIVQHPIKEYDGINGCCVYDTTSGLFLNVLQAPYEHDLSLTPDVTSWLDQKMHIVGKSPYIHLYGDYYMIDWKWQQLMPLSALSKAWKNALHDPFSEHISEHVFMTDISWNDMNDLMAGYETSEFTKHLKDIEIVRVDYFKLDQLYNDVKEYDPYVCYNLSLYHDGLSIVNAYMYYTYGDCSPARRTYLTYMDYCDSLQSVYQGRLVELIRNGKLKEIGY